ncbi:hypothetical protein HDV57DRAFT_481347, partial [Trichoderma longibrachiatum]
MPCQAMLRHQFGCFKSELQSAAAGKKRLRCPFPRGHRQNSYYLKVHVLVLGRRSLSCPAFGLTGLSKTVRPSSIICYIPHLALLPFSRLLFLLNYYSSVFSILHVAFLPGLAVLVWPYKVKIQVSCKWLLDRSPGYVIAREQFHSPSPRVPTPILHLFPPLPIRALEIPQSPSTPPPDRRPEGDDRRTLQYKSDGPTRGPGEISTGAFRASSATAARQRGGRKKRY